VDFRAALKASGVHEAPVHAATASTSAQLKGRACADGRRRAHLLAFPHPSSVTGAVPRCPLAGDSIHHAHRAGRLTELSLATAEARRRAGDVLKLKDLRGRHRVSVSRGIRDIVIAVPTGRATRRPLR
jgi:hypothetical protein